MRVLPWMESDASGYLRGSAVWSGSPRLWPLWESQTDAGNRDLCARTYLSQTNLIAVWSMKTCENCRATLVFPKENEEKNVTLRKT